MSKSIRSLIPPFVAFLIVLSCISCNRSPRYYLDNGNKLAAKGKLDEATINFRKAIQRDPNYGEAWYQLGLMLMRQHNTTEGYQALSHAIELLPDRDDIRIIVADIVLRAYSAEAGSGAAKVLYERLQTFSDQFLAKDASSYEGLRLKGYLAASDKKFPEAEDFFQKANAVKPMQPDLIGAWAMALFRDNQPEEARKLAFQLIEKDKTYGPVYDVLQQYYLGIGRRDEAENIARLRLNNNPNDARSAIDLAASYAGRSKEAEMKGVLQRMIDTPRSFPDARLQVGDFYARLRRWDDAIQQYQAGATADPKRKIAYLKRISDVWLAQGKGEQAAQVTAEILKQYPDDDAAKGVNASLLLSSRKPENIVKAVSAFQALADKHPENPVWNLNLGLAMAANGNADGARTQFQDAIRKRPDLLQAQIALAELSEAGGDYKDALQHADQILRLSPNLSRIRLLRAVSLMNTGQEMEAAKELAPLERAFPRDRDVQWALASLDLHDKKLPQAEERFRKLAKENEQDIKALTGLVQTLEAENQSEKAISLLQELLQKSPDSVGVESVLARTAAQTGKYDLAIGQYRRLLAGAPNSAQAHMELGEVLQTTGDLSGAISSFQKAITLAPDNATPHARLGAALAFSGRRAEALNSYRRALQLKPGNGDFLNAVAYLIAETGGDLNEALRLAQQALRVDLNQPNYNDTLGWVYFRKNQNDSAVQVFRNLTERHPEQATFHYHLGMALLQQGDKAAAKTELQNALTRKPEDQVRRDIQSALAKAG